MFFEKNSIIRRAKTLKAAIGNLIGFDVDESYPWKDTLIINLGVADIDDLQYKNCSSKILIKKVKHVEISDCRSIGEKIFIGKDIFVDLEYGVRLERIDKNQIVMNVTQECNEWLIICIQLLLLEQNCTFIHAAALEKERNVLLLPSWGGVGKTATVKIMVKEAGWKLLGDDLVILTEKRILPFLKPFVLYSYHKNLFPEIFTEHKGKIVTNKYVSNMISNLIPIIKKIMRPIPGLLAFARKHNPHSMRVSPMKIFTKDELSDGGQIDKIVWLERIVGNSIIMNQSPPQLLASKITSVTLMELFSDRTKFVYALIAAGLFDFQNIYVKMYNIVLAAIQNSECFELNIPTSLEVEKIGGIILEYL